MTLPTIMIFLYFLLLQPAAADSGDDFSNNLFTDLSPLLALFGERVTMQFLSQAMGLSDCIILAVAPLGIITIIVAAIRVSGPPWLKALIGRATEGSAAAELELMSSTSKEIGELWNGTDVVRCAGSAPVWEFICLLPSQGVPKNPVITIMSMEDAVKKSYITQLVLNIGMFICSRVVETSTRETMYQPKEKWRARLVWLQRKKAMNDQEFKSFALWTGEDQPVIINSERKPQNEKAKEANDEQSQSQSQDAKETAHQKIALEFMTVIGTVTSLVGFFAQFISIRGMHWSVSIASLIAVLIMTAVRAWVRRGLTTTIEYEVLSPGFELDWFAHSLKNIEKAPWLAKPTEPVGEENAGLTSGGITSASTVRSDQNSTVQSSDIVETTKCIDRRHHLANLTEWRGPISQEAITITLAIEATMDLLHSNYNLGSLDDEDFTWGYNIKTLTDEQELQFKIERQGDGKWKADAGEVEAALSLRLFYAKHQHGAELNGIELCPGKTDNSLNDDKWLRAKENILNPGIRILGPHTKRLQRHLEWWVPEDGPKVWKGTAKYIKPEDNISDDSRSKHINDNRNIEVENSRVVGIDPYRYRIVRDAVSQQPQRQSDNAPEEESQSFILFSERGVVLEQDDQTDTKRHLQFSRPYYRESRPGRWKFRLPEKNIFYQEEEREDPKEEDGQPSAYIKGEDSGLLFIKSQDPLERLYAKDMFSTFMWAAVKSLKRSIDGKIKIHSSQATLDNRDPWKGLALRHNEISKLAMAIQSTRLCSTEEAFISIISPLSMQKKLPALDVIVEMVRDHAKEFEKHQAWEDASRVYLQLGNHLGTFEVGSYTYVRAVAVLVVFKEAIEDMISACKKDYHSTISHSDLKNQLEWTMRNVDAELQQNLESLYRLGKGDILLGGNIKENFQSTYPDLLLRSANVYSKIQSGVEDQDLRKEKDKDIFDRTPLHFCAAFGEDLISEDQGQSQIFISNMQHLIEGGSGINACDIQGWTPLHYACRAGNIKMARFLLEKDAQFDIQGRDGTAPIHCAAEGSHFMIVKALLEYGANIDIADGFGDTALHKAAPKGSIETVETLQKHGNRRLRNTHGQTAIHMAAMGGLFTAIYHWVDDVNSKDHKNKTPLHIALESGRKDFVKRLLELKPKLKVEVNTKGGGKNRTPLHIACGMDDVEIVKALLNAGAKIDDLDDEGITPLLRAVQKEKQNIVELLTERGADQEIRVKGATALHFAAKTGNRAIFEHLRKMRADAPSGAICLPGKLLHAASRGIDNNDMIRHLVEFGVGVNEMDSEGRTPLHYAALHGNAGNIRRLVSEGANKEARDNKGYTALHCATQYDDDREKAKRCLRVLIESPQADINAADKWGKTTLHLLAITKDLADIIPDFIKAGAKIEAADQNKATPLHWAALAGYKRGIKVLVDHKAKVEALDDLENTPRMIAEYRGLSDWWEESVSPIVERLKKSNQEVEAEAEAV
ncbi:uncharacterized protein Triagg1_8073 [Trichoderma aggressivum f. europaeum]|uniref:Ankyrin repeat protein n=1 Tax=Trichoderma aggressivum f. europaeum TaxID=173218 RepID=A0AAE1I8R2_9HYPO|nr:hypothetical protein Triagg1_8073 [Trichoderma aggressivum f. europaeum]